MTQKGKPEVGTWVRLTHGHVHVGKVGEVTQATEWDASGGAFYEITLEDGTRTWAGPMCVEEIERNDSQGI